MIPSPYNRAVLFVSRETIWYAGLAARHEQSDKNWSYYGKSVDDARNGIWVPSAWLEDLKASPGDLTLSLMPRATEIAPPGFQQPEASAPPANNQSDDDVDFGA